jgi:hypothetical protein
MQRLAQQGKVVAGRARFLQQVTGCSVPAEEQHLAARAAFHQLHGQFRAVHARVHHHVGEQQVRHRRRSQFQRLRGVVGRHGGEAVLRQDDGERIRNHALVVYHQRQGLMLFGLRNAGIYGDLLQRNDLKPGKSRHRNTSLITP